MLPKTTTKEANSCSVKILSNETLNLFISAPRISFGDHSKKATFYIFIS